MGKLIVGCGYLGKRVANAWISAGETVYATTRRRDRFDEFRSLGIHPIQADITEKIYLDGPVPFDTVLFCVGFDRKSGNTIDQVYVDGLRNTLNALNGHDSRFIYISSTGVYGQNNGEWIDEDSECNPQRAGGKACLAAEEMLSESEFGSKSVILRMAGIYGPDRVPRIDKLLANEPFPAETNGYLNLIHVDDATTAIVHSQFAETNKRLIISDGNPVIRREFYSYAAKLLGKEIRFTSLPEESPKSQRALGDKRCRNRRMIERLRMVLRFPSYQLGLRAILRPD